MLAPPQLARPNDAAVRAHYLAVAEAIDLPVVVQDHPASSGVWMSVELLLDLAAASPRLRVIKLEDEPTPPKAGRLLAADPTLRVLGGLGGQMLIEELRRGCAGTMTGFGYPELLVDIVRRYRSGDHEGATLAFHRACPAHPVREPGRAQPAHPQAHLPAARRHRLRPGAGAGAQRLMPAPSPTWTTSSGACSWARRSPGHLRTLDSSLCAVAASPDESISFRNCSFTSA